MIDLHDARIRSARFDERAGVITIEVALATGRNTSLIFEGVRPSPHIAQMLRLGGTILDWAPSRGPGNTHVYLMDGVISIRAEKLSVK